MRCALFHRGNAYQVQQYQYRGRYNLYANQVRTWYTFAGSITAVVPGIRVRVQTTAMITESCTRFNMLLVGVVFSPLDRSIFSTYSSSSTDTHGPKVMPIVAKYVCVDCLWTTFLPIIYRGNLETWKRARRLASFCSTDSSSSRRTSRSSPCQVARCCSTDSSRQTQAAITSYTYIYTTRTNILQAYILTQQFSRFSICGVVVLLTAVVLIRVPL